MKKIIVCLIFLISFANAIQCYNGKTYVDIPETKLSDVGYTKYNITHSNFDCKIAYKRYLKIKEIEPVNISYITKNEKNEIEEPSKIGFLLPICLLVIIVCIIWIIKIAVQKEPQDEYYTAIQKEPSKPKNNVKTESVKSYDDSIDGTYEDEFEDLSQYYYKLEEERQKKEQSYFDAILGKNYPVKLENNVKSKEQFKPAIAVKTESVKSWDDLSREYSENLRKIEQERVKNGFYEISKSKPAYTIIKNKPFNNTLDKSKTAYELLLERPEWKAYRLKVLAERGEKCEWCGSTNKILHVHHKFYLKYPDGKHILPWEYNINCVLVLCKDCHTKAHKQYKIKSYYISY